MKTEKSENEKMKDLIIQYNLLKAQIAKLPKEELKVLKKELGSISKRVMSEKLIELREKLIPILKEYREVLKEEFKKTETSEKPQGNKSISLKTDIFTTAIIRSIKK